MLFARDFLRAWVDRSVVLLLDDLSTGGLEKEGYCRP